MGEFTASYERKFSDGNYGSEGLSMSWTWDPEEDEGDPDQSTVSAIQFLRKLVLTELAKSAAERVRWAANRELHGRESKPTPDVHAREPIAVSDLEDLPL